LPGEDIVLHFNVWDTGDHKWDSTVLLDNFLWSAETATVQTGRYEPGDGGVTGDPLEPASFERDYDASGLCDLGQHPTWTFWSWAATTPDDSSIEFFVKTAASEAELDTAQETALVFNSSLGPASLVGDDAVAQLGAEDTQNGTVIVQEALQAAGLSTDLNFVRVRSYLVPSSDGLSSPTLQSWNLQMACEDAE
jgi:hypothetical protein